VASHRVYVPWFPRAISKSLKRNVCPLGRFVSLTPHDFFVWLSLCTWLINKVVIVRTLAIKRLTSTLKTSLQQSNDPDCRRASRRREALCRACGGKADSVFGIGISDSRFRRIGFDRLAGFVPNSASPSGPESGGGFSPARFLRLLQTLAIAESRGGAGAGSFQVLRKNLV
jgi:hypothetical protein